MFLDRDGTMIEDVGYLDAIARVAFYPWTVDSIRALNRAGLAVVVVTNQSGIARGFFSEAFVEQTHRHISARLEAGGARIDAYYYCPHHPGGTVAPYARPCDCRKPARGLIEHAVADLGLDASRSFVVGDKWLDVQLGLRSRRARDPRANRERRRRGNAAAGRCGGRCGGGQSRRRGELDSSQSAIVNLQSAICNLQC